MCGIFGFITFSSSGLNQKDIASAVKDLFLLSESRGREASGLFASSCNEVHILKDSQSASQLIQSASYKDVEREAFQFCSNRDHSVSIVGHSRLVTNGSMEDNRNNQPVLSGNVLGVHNGIIVNCEDLWKKYTDVTQQYDVDSEVFYVLLDRYFKKYRSPHKALKKVFSVIEGAASVACHFTNYPYVLLGTNTGSLYTAYSFTKQTCVFTSEEYILRKFLERPYIADLLHDPTISQLKPNEGCVINLSEFLIEQFSFDEKKVNYETIDDEPSVYAVTDHSLYPYVDVVPEVQCSSLLKNVYEPDFEKIKSLRRCTRCVLPETMPFIAFDQDGVCNYCHNYTKVTIKGEDSLRERIEMLRKGAGRADCIVALSGGRDSSFGLHYVKNELGLNPIAYTYDWGMVTDLARRNQSRLCGKLGVEHIVISADIKTKRAHIRKNISAWLKNPVLGMVPLFMAGDKQFFYYANQVMQHNDIDLMFFSENKMEKTDFKMGFCGIDTVQYTHDRTHTLYFTPFYAKMQLAFYYARQFLRNPAYLNSSLWDTFQAYCSTYFLSHEYTLLFEYIPWDEKKINSILCDEYAWELSPDTTTTWRIGDGTAAFYNYIYLRFSGLTENDTFRSNQIREGLIDRDQALACIYDENQPRFSSIYEYLRLVDLSFQDVVQRISNKARF